MTVTNAHVTAVDKKPPVAAPKAPVASTNESATLIPDFSDLLTELMGTGEQAAPGQAQGEQAVPVVEGTFGPETPGLVLPAIFVEESEEPSTKEEEATEEPEEKATGTNAGPELLNVLTVPVDPALQMPANTGGENHSDTEGQESVTKGIIAGLQLTPGSLQEAHAQAASKSEMERAWNDVRKYEFKVEYEAEPRPVQSLQDAMEEASDAADKQALITTDPMINVRQDKLPPRIVLVQNAGIETRLPEHSKSDAVVASSQHASAPTSHFSEVIGSLGQVEHTAPAHTVKLPEMPQLKVVRSLAMEVGDADSQVVIRIQERSGDVSLQLKTASEPMRHDLESSVSSLLNALKQGEVKVSNVEVFRRQPIDKVRRMKEAR